MAYRTTFDVLRACAKVTRIPVRLLVAPNRFNAELPAKTAVAVVAVRHLGKSTSQVGNAMNRDHTTIIHALRERGKDREVLRIAEKIIVELDAPTWRERAAEQILKHGVSIPWAFTRQAPITAHSRASERHDQRGTTPAAS
jgi:hypothetical protein